MTFVILYNYKYDVGIWYFAIVFITKYNIGVLKVFSFCLDSKDLDCVGYLTEHLMCLLPARIPNVVITCQNTECVYYLPEYRMCLLPSRIPNISITCQNT